MPSTPRCKILTIGTVPLEPGWRSSDPDPQTNPALMIARAFFTLCPAATLERVSYPQHTRAELLLEDLGLELQITLRPIRVGNGWRLLWRAALAYDAHAEEVATRWWDISCTEFRGLTSASHVFHPDALVGPADAR